MRRKLKQRMEETGGWLDRRAEVTKSKDQFLEGFHLYDFPHLTVLQY